MPSSVDLGERALGGRQGGCCSIGKARWVSTGLGLTAGEWGRQEQLPPTQCSFLSFRELRVELRQVLPSRQDICLLQGRCLLGTGCRHAVGGGLRTGLARAVPTNLLEPSHQMAMAGGRAGAGPC